MKQIIDHLIYPCIVRFSPSMHDIRLITSLNRSYVFHLVGRVFSHHPSLPWLAFSFSSFSLLVWSSRTRPRFTSENRRIEVPDPSRVREATTRYGRRPPTKQAPLFGQRLSALRKTKGLTQRELADLLETTRQMVDYYERRAVNPALKSSAVALKLLMFRWLNFSAVKTVKMEGRDERDQPARCAASSKLRPGFRAASKTRWPPSWKLS
jgi:transcriptional regulator with XRE-family HTH domain